MKRYVTTTTLLTLLLLIGICDVKSAQASKPNANEVAAKTKLDYAQDMISIKNYDEAAESVMAVLETEGLPDPIRGRAFLMMGNIGFYAKNFNAAKIGYQWVLKLPGATSQDKEAAKQGLDLVEEFEKPNPK